MAPRPLSLVIAGAALLAASGPVEAHAFAQRYDLPLPLWHYLAGAGAAVALSFVVAALFMRGAEKPLPPRRLALPPGFARHAVTILRGLGVAAFVLLLAAGLFGEQGDWDSNPLPVAVWVVWWVGLAFVSALVGDVWPLLDPWRGLAAPFRRGRLAPLDLPAWVGVWPAVALFFGFAWAELAWTENAMPRKLATLILAYSLIAWLGMFLLGRRVWSRQADPFRLFFGLFGRFAPFAVERRDRETALLFRGFGSGLRQDEPPSASMTAFVILALATVGFDGLGETPLWEGVVGAAMQALYASGFIQAFGYTAAESAIKTLGLTAAPLLFAAVYLAVCALVGRLAGQSAGLTARRYVLTLVPIAVAYHLAHYLSYLLIQGQMIWPLLSDPFGRGWNLFGGRDHRLDIGVVGMGFVWGSAVVAIVAGHVAAVALAHLEALRPPAMRGGAAPSSARALGAQVPMLVLMIAYTMLSLWILSQPIVEV